MFSCRGLLVLLKRATDEEDRDRYDLLLTGLSQEAVRATKSSLSLMSMFEDNTVLVTKRKTTWLRE